jgi:hypothetical protein
MDCGDLRGFDLGTNLAGCAEARKVGGEAVGEVHHRCDETPLGEPSRKVEPRLGVEVLFQRSSFQGGREFRDRAPPPEKLKAKVSLA